MLTCNTINKSFGATRALADASIELYRGEVHGLIGENGSGKSTWSSIIAGLQQYDSGEMLLKGEKYEPQNVLDAQKSGVAMIVQEQGTVPGISVAANIFLGKENIFVKNKLVSVRSMEKAAQEALSKIGANTIDVTAMIESLTFEERKIVEIARSINDNPEVLIVDETTTALTRSGRNIIYDMMQKLKSDNKTVLFISHDLDELIEKCDRITVLKDGVVVGNLQKGCFDAGTLRKMMVGREISENYYRSDYESSLSDEVVLEAKNVTAGRLLEDVTFELHKGEILGIGGLSDCGMHELGRVLFGLEKTLVGSVKLMPGCRKINNSRMALRNKVGYLPKNRDQESLMLTASIKDNIMLSCFDLIKRAGFISPKKEYKLTEAISEEMNVKCRSTSQLVKELSGGNKQKVAVGKWIGNETDIFIMDCPTRGIDIGVKESIYQLMYKLKQSGKSIILISEELQELIGMSDRIMILKNGRKQCELQRSTDLTEHSLIDYLI